MNDYKTITKLFENDQDKIGFRLFKEYNIIKLNNKNNNNYDNNQIEFNTQSLSSKLINYSNAYIYIEVEIELEIPFDETDQGKKSIPKLIALKESCEIVKNLKIPLNNVIISNESNIHRSNLVNFILNNSYNSPSSYRNIRKSNQDTLNITNNKFITKETYFTKREDETNPHYITFKVSIFLKDISDYFRKIDLIQFGEFNINVQLIDNIFVTSREGCTYEIKNAYLYVEEVKLTDSDNVKCLKMLDNKFTKKINFMENHTLIFDGKLKEINEDFAINNIRNSDSVFIYRILNTKKNRIKQ